MTIEQYFIRGVKRSITSADVNDMIMFLSSEPKNRDLPKGVKLDYPYRVISVDENGWTRFYKKTNKTCISGCEPHQVGQYIIVARNVPLNDLVYIKT